MEMVEQSQARSELKLTDAQRKAMDETLLQHREKLIDLRATVQKAELELEPMMAKTSQRKARSWPRSTRSPRPALSSKRRMRASCSPFAASCRRSSGSSCRQTAPATGSPATTGTGTGRDPAAVPPPAGTARSAMRLGRRSRAPSGDLE